jgi:hypothetical protein
MAARLDLEVASSYVRRAWGEYVTASGNDGEWTVRDLPVPWTFRYCDGKFLVDGVPSTSALAVALAHDLHLFGENGCKELPLATAMRSLFQYTERSQRSTADAMRRVETLMKTLIRHAQRHAEHTRRIAALEHYFEPRSEEADVDLRDGVEDRESGGDDEDD